jgi:glucose/mannose-6-phosphate isomerase
MKMDELIAGFPAQLKEAVEIGKSAQINAPSNPIQNVLISGLGGSGIGGKIVAQLVSDSIAVPVTINNDYAIPAFVNENTLVIISSYSGNTEETLAAMEQALAKNAEVACITSGGRVLEIAKEKGLNHIVIPGGNPPRACLGYSLTQQFYLLHNYGLIDDSFENQLTAAIAQLERENDSIKQRAEKVANLLYGKTPVIYAEAASEGLAVRFRQQLNENSKTLCWHHVFPEMNHNELVGWAGGSEKLAVLIFRNESDYSRTQVRMNISKEIFAKYTNTIIELPSKGNSAIESSLYLIYLGDWISLYLAWKNEADPIEIEVIDYLKSSLSKV